MDKSWSKETVLQALVDFAKTNKRYPDHSDLGANPELPKLIIVYSMLGRRWQAAVKKRCEEEGVPPDSISTSWTKESVLNAMDKFVEQYNRYPKVKEMCRLNGLPSKPIVRRILGKDWRETLCRRYGFIILSTDLSWEDVVKQVKIFQSVHGRIPRIEEYAKKNQLPTPLQMTTIFGPDWSTRMKNEFGVRIRTVWSESLVVERVRAFVEANGYFPSKGDFQSNPTLPVIGTLYRIYGDYETAKKTIESRLSDDTKETPH